jgi:hypothetical protein
MTLKSLEQAATEVGVMVTRNHSRAKRARMILAKYNELDLAAGSDDPPSSKGPLILADPQPAFERLIDDSTMADAGDGGDTPPPQRGGVRPGAGRPAGMTDELSLMNRLSKQPHPAIKAMLEGLFDLWAARTCAGVCLTKDQAVDLALSWTNTLELIGVAQRVPVWAQVVLCNLWTTYNILASKAALARTAAQNRKLVASQVVQN